MADEWDDYEVWADGVHGLRKRHATRLWYRSIPVEEIPTEVERLEAVADEFSEFSDLAEIFATPDFRFIPAGALSNDPLTLTPRSTDQKPAPAAPIAAASALSARLELAQHASSRPMLSSDAGATPDTSSFESRQLRRLGTIAPLPNATPAEDSAPAPMPFVTPTDDGWRIAPPNAPTLLLSSSPLLDGRSRGPLLGPGSCYRIVAMLDGVVGVEVSTDDGVAIPGFCNTIDLACIDSRLVVAGGRHRTAGSGTKQRLGRLTQTLSGVTGSLRGNASQ